MKPIVTILILLTSQILLAQFPQFEFHKIGEYGSLSKNCFTSLIFGLNIAVLSYVQNPVLIPYLIYQWAYFA